MSNRQHRLSSRVDWPEESILSSHHYNLSSEYVVAQNNPQIIHPPPGPTPPEPLEQTQGNQNQSQIINADIGADLETNKHVTIAQTTLSTQSICHTSPWKYRAPSHPQLNFKAEAAVGGAGDKEIEISRSNSVHLTAQTDAQGGASHHISQCNTEVHSFDNTTQHVFNNKSVKQHESNRDSKNGGSSSRFIATHNMAQLTTIDQNKATITLTRNGSSSQSALMNMSDLQNRLHTTQTEPMLFTQPRISEELCNEALGHLSEVNFMRELTSELSSGSLYQEFLARC